MAIKGLLERFRKGLSKTAQLFNIRSWFGRKVDQSFLDDLEARLIQADVGVNAALVELVQHDGGEVGEQRIPLQPRGQDPFGDDEQPGVRGEAAFEPDLPSDLAANGPSLLLGDARRDGARRHPSRLQQDDRAGGHQRRRHPRAFARTRRGRQDQRALTIDKGASIAINVSLFPDLTFDPMRDFSPVSLIGFPCRIALMKRW